MTHPELSQKLLDEIHTVEGVISIIYKDFDTDTIPFQFAPDYPMQAAGMAHIPVLLATLMRIDAGKMSLDDCVIVPDLWITPAPGAFERGTMSYSIDELLSWMIIANEDTPANVLIELMGLNYINGCCRRFGMKSTLLESYVGRTKIPSDSRKNITCAQDILVFFENIYRNRGLSRWLCEYAGRLFLRQRGNGGFTRYICDDIDIGRKGGESGIVSHEAGIFYLRYVDYFLAIFTSNADATPRSQLDVLRMRGRVANLIYNYYLEREDAIHNLPYDPRGPYGGGRR